jgi:hypothetical protein
VRSFLLTNFVARSVEATGLQFSYTLGFFQNCCWSHPSFCLLYIWDPFFRDKGDWNLKQATHFHLEPRLRIRGTLSEVPYFFNLGCLGTFVFLLGEDRYES